MYIINEKKFLKLKEKLENVFSLVIYIQYFLKKSMQS